MKKILEAQLLSQLKRETESVEASSQLLAFLNEREGERGLKELRLYYSIAVSHNPRHHQDLFLLCCDGEDSPKEARVVRECKGVVVQRVPEHGEEWRVCGGAYDVFADGDDVKAREEWLQEARVDPSKASDVVIFEQMSGMGVSLYYVDHRWMVSSLHSVDASKRVERSDGGGSVSLGDLFWRLLPGGLDQLKSTDEDSTFLWEILRGDTWYHHHTPQEHTREGEEWLREFTLVLHGVKRRRGLDSSVFDEEIDPASVAESHGWHVVRRVEGMTVDEASREARRI